VVKWANLYFTTPPPHHPTTCPHAGADHVHAHARSARSRNASTRGSAGQTVGATGPGALCAGATHAAKLPCPGVATDPNHAWRALSPRSPGRSRGRLHRGGVAAVGAAQAVGERLPVLPAGVDGEYVRVDAQEPAAARRAARAGKLDRLLQAMPGDQGHTRRAGVSGIVGDDAQLAGSGSALVRGATASRARAASATTAE